MVESKVMVFFILKVVFFFFNILQNCFLESLHQSIVL